MGDEFTSSRQRANTFHVSLSCFFSNEPGFIFAGRSLEISMASFVSFIRQEKNHFPLHLRNKWKAASQLNEAQQSLISC